MGALKDLYSVTFYSHLADNLAYVMPGFDSAEFDRKIFTAEFDGKELKERMRHTAVVLHEIFPNDYKATVAVIKKMIDRYRTLGIGEDGLAHMFLADYIEVYGLDDYHTSVDALEYITQFVSCEFAVRPFLIKYGEQMLSQMLTWSLHPNHKVRRLASEGSRPRLPWAMAVPMIKKNPALVIPILENLKNDPSEWVRRSVANNLNDIAKDNPDLVLQIARQWAGTSKQTDAIIKHGSRTLLKQGHTEILKHYGLDSAGIALANFELHTPEVKIGDNLDFSFAVANTNTTAQTVRLEYAIYYRMQNGKPSKKVYKISERIYQAGQQENIHRRQKFVLITTRKFYVGTHRLAIIINGDEQLTSEFLLK